MADAISVGNGKYLYYVNDSIQGMGGKPFAHKPGKKLVCQTADLTQLLRNNGCLCNYQAVKVYRTFCYLLSLSVEVYKLGRCPQNINTQTYASLGTATLRKRAMVWKWCGWYEYVGCQGYPGGGGWTDPLIGDSLDKASKKQLTLCSPQYIGNKEYTHSVQQRLVTSYQCCTTDGGLQGCCRLVDSDSLGQKKCVTSWTISRLSPTASWGSWQFLQKIGCVGQNAYLADKASLTTKIDILSCTAAKGYSITSCGTCSDSNLYKQFPPNSKPTFKCKYWVLYYASYVLDLLTCGWGDWALWDWSSLNPPDQSIVKGTNGWAPLDNSVCKTADGRKADKLLYLCKTKRVWYWKAFDTEQQKSSFDPSSIREADANKCKPCTLSSFLADHTQHTPKSRLNKGLSGAPCVLPLLPRAVIKEDLACYDLYLYQLDILDAESDPQLQQGCKKKLSYKRDPQTQQKAYRKIALGKTLWQLLTTVYDGVMVMDNLGRTIQKEDGSWYFLRAVPCGLDPLEWNLDGGAALLPQSKQQVDACIRVFLVGVYCALDPDSPIILDGQVTGYNRKPYILSLECDKWLKLGNFTQLLITLSAADIVNYKYDLTKTNQWQIPRWIDPGLKFLQVYIKTSTTRDNICDKYPLLPKGAPYRSRILLLLLTCSGDNNWDGLAEVKWPLEALCIEDNALYCSPVLPVSLGIYKDRQLKQPVSLSDGYYIIQGCKAYLCLLASVPSGQCNTSYLKTQEILQVVDKVVFDNCAQYVKYSLWQTTTPCACFESQDPDCTIWSIFPKLNTQQQITACSCDQLWAVLLIKRWLRLYTLGLQQSLDAVITELISKLQPDTPVLIKKQDGTFVIFYLQSTDIEKPLLWDDEEGVPLTQLQIAYLYIHDPCQFAQDLDIPDILLKGKYACTLMKLVPLCRLQSDSKLPDYGGVYIANKYDLQSDYCLTGLYILCLQEPPADQNYYLDNQCQTRCPYSALSELLVLLPPSDARLLWYLATTSTLIYMGSLAPLISCLAVTLQDKRIVKSANIQWGGQHPLSLQLLLDCCPRYLFKYLYVVKAVSNPCLVLDANATILLVQDPDKTGWLSYLPVKQSSLRLWKDFDPARQLIIGLPTCQTKSTLCLWICAGCSQGALNTVFQLLIVLDTPFVAASSTPWQLISGQCTPDTSNCFIKLTGHESYIPGTGTVFLWDVQSASVKCVTLQLASDIQSLWDNTNCNAQGHLFTYYSKSPLVYGKCHQGGTRTDISPRDMTWTTSIAHPDIPKAKWTMTRTYNLDRTLYTDDWCSLLDAVAYCGQDLCLWEGAECAATWRLSYTQALQASLPPQDSPLACWNKNAPSFLGCLAWIYTRKYTAELCTYNNGSGMRLSYLNIDNLSSNWRRAALIPLQQLDQWVQQQDCVSWQYATKRPSSKPNASPLSLFGAGSPPSVPGYIKVDGTADYIMGDTQVLLQSVQVDTILPACSSQSTSYQCNGSSVSFTYYIQASIGTCYPAGSVSIPTNYQPTGLFVKTVTWNCSGTSGNNCRLESDWVFQELTCPGKSPVQPSCGQSMQYQAYSRTRGNSFSYSQPRCYFLFSYTLQDVLCVYLLYYGWQRKPTMSLGVCYKGPYSDDDLLFWRQQGWSSTLCSFLFGQTLVTPSWTANSCVPPASSYIEEQIQWDYGLPKRPHYYLLAYYKTPSEVPLVSGDCQYLYTDYVLDRKLVVGPFCKDSLYTGGQSGWILYCPATKESAVLWYKQIYKGTYSHATGDYYGYACLQEAALLSVPLRYTNQSYSGCQVHVKTVRIDPCGHTLSLSSLARCYENSLNQWIYYTKNMLVYTYNYYYVSTPPSGNPPTPPDYPGDSSRSWWPYYCTAPIVYPDTTKACLACGCRLGLTGRTIGPFNYYLDGSYTVRMANYTSSDWDGMYTLTQKVYALTTLAGRVLIGTWTFSESGWSGLRTVNLHCLHCKDLETIPTVSWSSVPAGKTPNIITSCAVQFTKNSSASSRAYDLALRALDIL